MKEYLVSKSYTFNKDFISIIDELPLWAAPFGLKLLEKLKIGRNLKVLDIGSGTGFPLLEIAQRLGETSVIYGIDPWLDVLNRAQLKIANYRIKNAAVISGYAEELPFSKSYFDVIVSNNGINNVEDLNKTISECRRVSKKGAQFLFTMNLDKSMMEFYNVLKDELEKESDSISLDRLEKHIYEKRRPLSEIKMILNENHFEVKEVIEDKFYLRFADATTMFNHSFIKYWFLDNWKKIAPVRNTELIFDRVKSRLNSLAEEQGELKLSIPFAVINCTKL
ncbi:MAG: methyltransferase domain-containing protein [Ignavibacteriaceae bacterium]|nr:methyltransferase domain-containing protein [Ignavibacteriaceae bacterium]